MFRQPKQAPVEETVQPDLSDIENRRNTERRRRLSTGGTQSTMLSTAMRRTATEPTATLTGKS